MGRRRVSKQKAKARRQKKVAKKKTKAKKELVQEGETKPRISEGQVGEAKPGELIGTTAG